MEIFIKATTLTMVNPSSAKELQKLLDAFVISPMYPKENWHELYNFRSNQQVSLLSNLIQSKVMRLNKDSVLSANILSKKSGNAYFISLYKCAVELIWHAMMLSSMAKACILCGRPHKMPADVKCRS